MNRSLIPAFALTSVLLFTTGCGEKAPEIVVAPAKPKLKPTVYQAPDPQAEAALREATLQQEIAALEVESEKIQFEIGQEQNAQVRAALEEERAQLERDRAAWLEQQQAELAASEAKARKRTKDDAPSVNPPLPAARDYSLFYSDLSPHGRWFDSPDYGYIWQPAVASSPDWQPYTVGNWASCDKGWTWVSDEPFGWATYHYGRWARIKNWGWIWVPGDTWAPAWVSWRQNEQFIGWCPLPPATLYHGDVVYDADTDKRCGISPSCYTFIAIKHFGGPVQRHCEPPARSVEVCRTTVNITRLSIRRGKVDRSGPTYEWIKDRLPNPPVRYNLVCGTRPDHDRRFRMEQGKLLVFSPVMKAPWNAALRPLTPVDPLPVARMELQGITVPEKGLQRFREERKTWLATAARSMKTEALRGLTGRQDRVAALDKIVTSQDPMRSVPPASAEPGSRQQRQAELQRQIAERQASLANPPKPGQVAESGRPDANVSPLGSSPDRQGNAAERQEWTGKAPASSSQSTRPTALERPAKPSPGLTPAGDSSSRTHARATASPSTPEVPGVDPAASPEEAKETKAPTSGSAGPPQDPQAPKVTEAGTPLAASDELAARREKALRLKGELAARQQALEQARSVADKVPETTTSTPVSTPAVVPETPAVPRLPPALPDSTAVAAARLEKATRLKEELAAKQERLQQQRAAAQVAEKARAADSQVREEAARQQQEARQTSLANQRATAEQERQNQQIQQQEAAAAALEQQRQEKARLAQAQAQAQAQAEEQAAGQTQQTSQEAAEPPHGDPDGRQRTAGAKTAHEAAAQEQQQRQTEERQREAAGRAQQAEASRQEQQQRLAEARARQQEEARQQQQQREAEEQQHQAAEARARQQEEARQQQQQREAEERQRQAAEARARQQEEARQQQQREAEEHQRQAAEARARQQEEARQQQQQREAEERQRQAAQERAREEEAARAAAGAAKNGK